MRPLLPALLSAVLLAACGSDGAIAARGETAVADDGAARLVALTAEDQRVARVAARLWRANAELCPIRQRGMGWQLHAASLYSGDLRPHAEARFGLEGDLPGVLAAPEGTAAARAGLAVGDLILAVDGRPLARGAGERPRYEGFAANVLTVDRALASGARTLTVRRAGETRQLAVEPELICGYEVQLDPSNELNARADRRRVYLAAALVGFAGSDDELAIIMGHELAHAVLQHHPWTDAEAYGRERHPRPPVSTRVVRDHETDADRVGLYLMARAGYDPAVAPAFWRRFGASNWRVRWPQLTHASAGARARALEGVAAEIAARRAAGEPLIP